MMQVHYCRWWPWSDKVARGHGEMDTLGQWGKGFHQFHPTFQSKWEWDFTRKKKLPNWHDGFGGLVSYCSCLPRLQKRDYMIASKSCQPLIVSHLPRWLGRWPGKVVHIMVLCYYVLIKCLPCKGNLWEMSGQASINNRFKIGVSSICTSPRTSTEPNDTQSALGEEVMVTKRHQLMWANLGNEL